MQGTAFDPPSSGEVALETARGVVLVIDDEAAVRTIARRMLEHMGYQVMLAESGAAGLDALRSRHTSLCAVMVDLTMPHMRGDVVAQAIKAEWPHLPVILMSGYSAVELTALAPGLGIAGVLQKPFTLAALRTAMGRML
jgi:DNA-binding NtrC family response regulator